MDTNIVNFMLLGAGLKKKNSLNNLELCSEVRILENSFIPLMLLYSLLLGGSGEMLSFMFH